MAEAVSREEEKLSLMREFLLYKWRIEATEVEMEIQSFRDNWLYPEKITELFQESHELNEQIMASKRREDAAYRLLREQEMQMTALLGKPMMLNEIHPIPRLKKKIAAWKKGIKRSTAKLVSNLLFRQGKKSFTLL